MSLSQGLGNGCSTVTLAMQEASVGAARMTRGETVGFMIFFIFSWATFEYLLCQTPCYAPGVYWFLYVPASYGVGGGIGPSMLVMKILQQCHLLATRARIAILELPLPASPTQTPCLHPSAVTSGAHSSLPFLAGVCTPQPASHGPAFAHTVLWALPLELHNPSVGSFSWRPLRHPHFLWAAVRPCESLSGLSKFLPADQICCYMFLWAWAKKASTSLKVGEKRTKEEDSMRYEMLWNSNVIVYK